MFGEEKEKIQKDWQEEAYPRSNSITSNNGLYCLFELSAGEHSAKNKIWRPASDFSLEKHVFCEGLATLCTTVDSKGNVIHGGECFASGDDGFIALTRTNTNELIWLIVLSTTNPFVKMEWQNNFIYATSSSGTKVTIPPQRPDTLTIQWNL